MSEPVILPSKLDLAAATALNTTLSERTDDAVVLDLSQVKHFGALCMQIVIAAATHAKSEDRQISLINVSDRVIDQLRVMGMTPETITRRCE